MEHRRQIEEKYIASPSSSRFRRLLDRVRRWWKKEPDLPADPFANRMAPLRRGPKGRSGAAAIAEPDDESVTDVRARAFWQRKA
jgi:hypothetical protein